MYSRRYVIESIEEFGNHNRIYDGVEGCICYPAYFKVGERGWFLYVEDLFFKEYAHRIHTSIIQSVEYTNDGIIVVTENTKFVFRVKADFKGVKNECC